MTSGHTVKVRTGEITELRDYALLSFHAWRAADDHIEIDLDFAPLEERSNPYYSRKLEEAQARLATLRAVSAEEAKQHAHSAHEKAHAAWSEWRLERKARLKRTRDMLAKLDGWTPPSPDLAELKHFMRENLKTALAHDEAETEPPKPSRAAARKHLAEAIERAERDVAHYAVKVAEEEERVARETERLRALISSFGG